MSQSIKMMEKNMNFLVKVKIRKRERSKRAESTCSVWNTISMSDSRKSLGTKAILSNTLPLLPSSFSLPRGIIMPKCGHNMINLTLNDVLFCCIYHIEHNSLRIFHLKNKMGNNHFDSSRTAIYHDGNIFLWLDSTSNDLKYWRGWKFLDQSIDPSN